MRRIIDFLLPALLFLGLLILFFGLAFALVLLVTLGMSWVLRFFLALTFFESLVLATLMSAGAVYVMITVGRLLAPEDNFRLPTMGSSTQAEEERDYKQIATARFYKSDDDRTWNSWLRREIANDIYVGFQDEPRAVSNMNDTQVQELALRLSDLALAILKRKTPRARDLNVTLNALKRELQRVGQRAYDDKILQLAVNAINLNMDYYENDIFEVIRTQAWDELADVPEGDA